LSAKLLKDMGLEKVSHIVTGFGGWKSDGFATVDYETWKNERDQ
jgi:rhodanese-related sulfurtransferase